MRRALEIMDTTLRDGEQTSGVSFTSLEKLTLAKLLLQELKVDRIEIASARVSDGEFNAVKEITSWASSQGLIEAIEVLTFVDNGVSIQWMKEAGAQVQNLLIKGSMNLPSILAFGRFQEGNTKSFQFDCTNTGMRTFLSKAKNLLFGEKARCRKEIRMKGKSIQALYDTSKIYLFWCGRGHKNNPTSSIGANSGHLLSPLLPPLHRWQ